MGRYSRNNFVSNRSGDTYRNLQLLFAVSSSVCMTSFLVIPEKMENAVMLLRRRFSTWSFINAISGLMTRQIPSFDIAGTWKHIDFPPPVGNNARVSFPFNIDWIISSCMGRNDSYPQYSLSMLCMLFTVACKLMRSTSAQRGSSV